MKQGRIVRHYLGTFFLIDVGATLPWEYILGDGSSATARFARAGKMLRLLRLLRVLRLREVIERLEELLPSAALAIVMSLGKTLLMFSVICHWCACFWGFIGNPEKVNHDSAELPPLDQKICEPGGA